jgi:hypothetical protein
MTEQQHPITPPPELVSDWRLAPEYTDGLKKITMVTITVDRLQYIATQAAQWGSDQELEACCKWFQEFYKTETWVDLDLKTFRAARRPKPPSLKEQALEKLAWIDEKLEAPLLNHCDAIHIIRRALEQLDG